MNSDERCVQCAVSFLLTFHTCTHSLSLSLSLSYHIYMYLCLPPFSQSKEFTAVELMELYSVRLVLLYNYTCVYVHAHVPVIVYPLRVGFH